MSRVQTVVEATVKAGRLRQQYRRSITKGNLQFSPERCVGNIPQVTVYRSSKTRWYGTPITSSRSGYLQREYEQTNCWRQSLKTSEGADSRS